MVGSQREEIEFTVCEARRLDIEEQVTSVAIALTVANRDSIRTHQTNLVVRLATGEHGDVAPQATGRQRTEGVGQP